LVATEPSVRLANAPCPCDPTARAHAVEFIDAALSLTNFPARPPRPTDIDLLRTSAIVKVPAETSFSLDGAEAEIRFRADIDDLNFSETPAGTLFATLAPDSSPRLQVIGEDAGPEAQPWFTYGGGEIRLARDAIPAMLTLDPRAVRLDCLCYLMRRIDPEGGGGKPP